MWIYIVFQTTLTVQRCLAVVLRVLLLSSSFFSVVRLLLFAVVVACVTVRVGVDVDVDMHVDVDVDGRRLTTMLNLIKLGLDMKSFGCNPM